jgi:hypothetical protein
MKPKGEPMEALVQFLRARLDEDEALAHEAPPGPWHIGNAVDPTQPCNVHTFPSARLVADGLNWLAAEHIAHHHPARVLAEVEAKRRIVQALESAEVSLRNTKPGKEPHELMTGAANSLQAAVRMLAAAYADHPHYREEWRP